MQQVIMVLILVCLGLPTWSQNISGIINTYVEVTDVDITESSVDVVSSAGISVNDSLIIIQMQGAEISSSSVDTLNGIVTNYNGAGSWEKVHVCSVSGNTIHFKKEFDNVYDGAGAVQLIPIEIYNNAVITDTLKCQPWNGATGGVLLLFNVGVLDCQAPINVNNCGFRGGQHSEATNSCSFLTSLDDFDYTVSSGNGAMKGEGVSKYTSLDGGRGPTGNGGGGGNDHNSGGGGGSNVANAGKGGDNDDPGFVTCKGYSPGQGGRGMVTDNYRLFLGGGGGAGHSNSVWNSSGERGAGIVIIVSDEVAGNGETIFGYGVDAPEAHGDGAGGGGAGGAVCLLADVVSSALTIDLHGGKGGNMDASIAANTDRCFGPGGGGGGGTIRYKTATAPANVTTILNGGAPGIIVLSTAGCNGSSLNARSGGSGIQEFNGEIPEGIKCNEFCALVHSVNLGDDVNSCEADSIVLDAQNPGLNYAWSTGETSQTIEVYGAAQISVIVDDGFCLACDTINVSHFTRPDYPSETSFDVCDGGTVTLDAENSGATYIWSTGDTTQTILVNSGGVYEVGIYRDNCSRAAFFDVFECFSPPNTITPNNDGSNDTWIIDNIQNYNGNKVEIYNRRGQVVYKTTDYNNTFAGDGLPAGVYYYNLNLNNGRDPILGSLTIIR